MTGVDTNFWCTRTGWIRLGATRRRRRLSGWRKVESRWAIPWPCVHEFFAVVTHPKIYRPSTPVEKALADLDEWFRSPTLRLVGETGVYWGRLRETIVHGGLVGPMVHDARIAAICAANGVSTLLSADRDFSRFPGLRVRNPLV